jgi:DNA-binding NarL/FixJ family response regulator
VDPLRVIVVGGDALARAGVAARLAGREDLRVAGDAPPAEAERAAAVHLPDAIVWDLGTGPAPDEGSRGTPLSAARAPVVALASDEAQGADAARSGARAVLFRTATADELAAAVAAAVRGLTVLERELAEAWLRPREAAPRGEGLTSREREVLALLAEGLGNKAIAARLGISEHTAKFHVNAILGKLGVESRAEAIVRAARLGLVVL